MIITHSFRITQIRHGLLCIVMLLAAPQQVYSELSMPQKSIQIGKPDSGALQVVFEATKAEFKVGEPLRFRINGNKRFFLYLYSVDEKTGQSILFFPNRLHKGNQYEGKQTYQVPNKTAEFFSDAAGQEHIVMVASARYLAIDTKNFHQSGDFMVAKTAVLEGKFESKGIQIRGPKNRQTQDKIIKELDIKIKEAAIPSTVEEVPVSVGTSDQQAIVFVSTEKEHYQIGDHVRILFGADQAGWVSLYTIEPGGSRSLLKQTQVTGKKLHHVTAKAETPAGKHQLLVVFSHKKEIKKESLAGLEVASTRSKRLSLVSEKKPPVAVRQIWVDE